MTPKINTKNIKLEDHILVINNQKVLNLTGHIIEIKSKNIILPPSGISMRIIDHKLEYFLYCSYQIKPIWMINNQKINIFALDIIKIVSFKIINFLYTKFQIDQYKLFKKYKFINPKNLKIII